jgi:hypothetical protein
MTLADKIRAMVGSAKTLIAEPETVEVPDHTSTAAPYGNRYTYYGGGQSAPVVPQPLEAYNVATPNYPVATPATPENSLHYYNTDKQATDNYWSAVRYSNQAQQRPGVFTSLTGEQVTANELEHNNMQPFFGGNVTQSVPDQAVESRLDNMTGAGSQYIHHRGSAPLFEPAPNHGTPYGMQSHTDFLQCRQVPSQRIANAKPFEEQRVAPGLGLGAGTNEGEGGYNAGVSARESWLPYTVDQLRAPNKPKVSYAGQILGGRSGYGVRAEIGAQHQKGPDRTMALGEGLTPVAGSAWGEAVTSREEYATPHSDRGMGAALQPGPAGTSVPLAERRDQTPNPVHRVGAIDMGNRVQGPAQQYGAPGYVQRYDDQALPTARGSGLGSSFYGAAMGLAREVIMPVLGTFKLQKKESTTQACQLIAPAGPEGTYQRYGDKPKATLRETTLTSEVGPASGTVLGAMGWGIKSEYGTPRKQDVSTPPLIGAGSHQSMVSREATQNAYVPSHRSDLQVPYTTGGGLAMLSYNQGDTRLRNTPEVKDYLGGMAPVIPSGTDTRQVGQLTHTKSTYGGSGADPNGYAEILSQLGTNPYMIQNGN